MTVSDQRKTRLYIKRDVTYWSQRKGKIQSRVTIFRVSSADNICPQETVLKLTV